MVTARVAIIHGVVGTLIPLFVACLLTRFFGVNRSWREGLGAWKFALFAGVAFTVPYMLLGVFLGPRFPSLLGGLIALALTVAVTKAGWFQPRENWDFAPETSWDPEWLSSLPPQTQHDDGRAMSLWLAWVPYLLVGGLLVAFKLIEPIRVFVAETAAVGVEDVLGTALKVGSAPLKLPGTVFLIVALLCRWCRYSSGRARTRPGCRACPSNWRRP